MRKIGAHVAHFKPRRVKPIYKTHGVAGFDVDKLFNVALIEAPSNPFSVKFALGALYNFIYGCSSFLRTFIPLLFLIRRYYDAVIFL